MEEPINPRIAMDEAGNTGAHLLDPAQPVFVLASVHLPHEEAATLVERAAGRAKEAHFVAMRRSSAGRRRVLDVLNERSLAAKVRLSMYHKPFMVTTKMVDQLIETMAHEDGYDLYERGANLAMANLWHLGMPVVIGRERFERLQRLFVNVVRGDRWADVAALHQYTAALYNEFRRGDWEMHFGLLFAAVQRIAARDFRGWNDSTLDPAFPTLVDLGSYWTARIDAPFDIVHDESGFIRDEQALFERLMSIDEPTTVIGYDRRKRAFPIKATGIRLVDSAQYPEVQLADVVAGAISYGLKKRALRVKDGFADEILDTPILKVEHDIIWPTPHVDPADLGTEEVGGINPVDHVAEYLGRTKAVRR